MIRLEKIDKHFGENRVLSSVDLQLASGNVTALIGPSGSGKSTLLRCVNLLEIPEAGSLELGDQRLEFSRDHKPPRETVLTIRRRTGMVFQNFQLFPHLTVRQNVMEGLLTVLKWDKEKARVRADELLDKVGIKHKADAWPSTLSGGQQQRVAIARALAPSPEVLLCDEPTSALDPGLAAEVVDVLKQLATEGMTMLMATHDLRLAATIARDVVFLNNGVVVEQGPSRDIFMNPREPETARFVSTLTHSLPDAWTEQGRPERS
ncbi:amino acid ABC transporter ATP-binding protein, PAAT family [Burkholderia sp. GAS332]|jgi:cystine transport system ATP-binding protein|uniref:amino acid ABC transporter ATP-binding protein n=1 Tax=Paraburkholderia TaxID=1822464 RepID=UPI000928A28D|nr:amino acid ABC transporter ATP-binding protein, PAAT family [Burkholderia sp. GAS332]